MLGPMRKGMHGVNNRINFVLLLQLFFSKVPIRYLGSILLLGRSRLRNVRYIFLFIILRIKNLKRFFINIMRFLKFIQFILTYTNTLITIKINFYNYNYNNIEFIYSFTLKQ